MLRILSVHGWVSLCAAALAALPLAGTAGPAEDQFDFATGLLIKKEFQLAADEFDSLVSKHPDFKQSDVALYRLGEAWCGVTNTDRAVTAFEQLVARFPKSDRLPQAYYRLGQLTAAKDHRKAAAHYAAVAEKWPTNALAEAALYWSAEECFRAEDWDGAARAYAAVTNRFPAGKYVPHALYSLGWAELSRDRPEAALAATTAFLTRFAQHELAPECRLKQAEALYRLKRHGEAAGLYAALVKEGNKRAPDAAVGYAWCLYDQRRFKDAAQAFVDAAKLLAGDPRAATAAFNAGNALLEEKDYAGAARLFEAAARDYPGDKLAGESSYWQGYCLVRQKAFAEALKTLEALRTSGKAPDRQVEIGFALAEAKFGTAAFAEAAALYGDIARNHAAHALADKAAYGRVLALERGGDLAGAEAAAGELLQAFAGKDTAPLARFARAEYRFRQGAFDKAAEDLTAFLAGPKNDDLADDALYKLGWCRLNAKAPSEARKHFEDLLARFPQSPLAAEAAYTAGRAAEDAGDKPAAVKLYDACLTAYPGTEHALRADLARMLLSLADKQPADALARSESFLKGRTNAALRAYAWLYKGEALNDLGRYEEASQAYANVKEGDAPHLDAVYGTAWAQRKLAHHDAAAGAFRKVAASPSPKAVDAAFWVCRSLDDAGKTAEAAAAYADFLTRHASSPRAEEAAYRLAAARLAAKDWDAAEKLMREFAEKHASSEFADNALYDLGWLYREKGDPERAVETWERMLKAFPATPLKADTCFRLGEARYDGGQFAQAAANYDLALQGEGVPFADKVLYKLGWALSRVTNQTDRAVEAFRRIPREHAKSDLADEARYRAGKLLQEQGRFADATAEFKAVTVGEFAERAVFGQAECERLQGRHREALDLYDRLLKEFPESSLKLPARLGKGHSCRALGAHKDAIENYEAVTRDTATVDAAQAVLGTGYSLFAQDQFVDAAKAFLKVDILYGYEELKPEALHMIAQCWSKAGDEAKAKKYRDELKLRYPDSEFAKK